MINIDDTGLIVIDVQGKLARMVYENENLIANIQKLIKGCTVLNLPIVWLEQYPKGLGRTVPEISDLLIDQKPYEKTSFNALEEITVVNRIVELEKTNWIVCGIEAHICVYQTIIGLLHKNYHVELVADCISARKKESIDIALNRLMKEKIGITNIEMCLYELMKNSRRKEFKEILPLIK